jgi:hypothetical protein
MHEWWTYGLADAQIFSARAYDRLVERCMREAWPAQLLVVALGVVVLLLLWWRPRTGARALAAVTALACTSVAAWWLAQCYSQLHWAAGWMAGGFALQALLLALAAASPHALDRAAQPGPRTGATVLFGFALIAFPWLSMPAGSGLWRAELVGLMPAPTISACLALVPLLTARWWLPLLALPVAGIAVEAVTQASIGREQWLLLPANALFAALAMAWRRTGRTRPDP